MKRKNVDLSASAPLFGSECDDKKYSRLNEENSKNGKTRNNSRHNSFSSNNICDSSSNFTEDKNEKVSCKKRKGAQDIGKKSEISKQGIDENRKHGKNAKGKPKEGKTDDNEGNSTSIKICTKCKKDGGCNGKAGSGKGGDGVNSKGDKGGAGKVGRRKPSPPKKTDGIAGDSWRNYPLGHFDKSEKVLGHILLQKPPRKTSDSSIVEIIVDGKRYKVSSWSIRNNEYIQGLDSNFLVTKYKTHVKKKEQLNGNNKAR